MNCVKFLSIALLVICAVPAACAVKGRIVSDKFYPESAIVVAHEGTNKEVRYIVDENCVQVEVGNPLAINGKPVDATLDNNGNYTYKDAQGTDKVAKAGDTPKYAVTDYKGDPIEPGIFMKVNKAFHGLEKDGWGQKACKAGLATLPVLAGFVAYHASPAAKRKIREAYAKLCNLVQDAKEDNSALLKLLGLAAVGVGAGYGLYTYGDDLFYAVTMIDKNDHNGAYTK